MSDLETYPIGQPRQLTGPQPALSPPPIKPWRDFDLSRNNDYTRLIRLIAELLMDDQWHTKDEVFEEAHLAGLALCDKTIGSVIDQLRAYGDVRGWNRGRRAGTMLRIAGRWRGWEDVHPCPTCGGDF
ncbi:Uncharacterised protein [Mycobacteroides abscessus subsp. bolletii]|uniref:hypothetical protein n=1 Tax=Mycobacteroides abscessus TaxID=36809 RepID=UPI0009C684A0|nr:hypothetical protein [Mycobacteroides abscessus]SKR94508.1 Uncharacterised protein [Mycobacteroides abscessus subsp. bolletii]SKS03033.1 Uncharacterised protein [Mycobacteroides abscessus subsp. bolletii]DAZ90127.1 TPA_asm: hypothetical protein PROPHIFVLQ01-1_40 [Mycobacterium phage prophiFVLQ01-1]